MNLCSSHSAALSGIKQYCVVCNAYAHKSGESLNQIISQGSRK